MDLEVLVTTMNQHDMSKYDSMNLNTNVIIANQSDYFGYEEKVINENEVKMISTKTRGTSRNRNIAMSLSTSEYIVFADDDMKFVDNYESIIEKEFTNHKDAEAIKFFVDDSNSVGKVSWKKPDKFIKATRRNVSSAGVVALVIKNDILKKYNLHFNENFGPGSDNFCGEDTIFLQELINKKVKFFISSETISYIYQQESTWFKSFDEKYFKTVGKVLATIYPILSYLIVIRSAFRTAKRKQCSLSFFQILKCYYKGITEK